MAGREVGGSPSATVDANEQTVEAGMDERSETEVRSSETSIASAPSTPACQYRNPQFHDQECSRYFDCPTHQLERASAAAAEPNHEIDGQHQETNTSQITSSDEHSGSQEVSPVLGSPRAESITHQDVESSPHHSNSHREAQEEAVQGQSNLSPEQTSVSEMNELVITEQDARDLLAAPYSPSPPPTSSQLTENVPESTTSSRPSSSSSRSSLRPNAPLFRPASGQSGILAIGPRQPSRTASSDVTLPPWQPDSEVARCPICHTDFSLWCRRHHCRKCGRVVCANCSPHRITIPHQYIVRPPGEMPNMGSMEVYRGERGVADFNISLGGGEKVRLCNPCVPDPNTTPPQLQRAPNAPPYSYQSPRSGHQRSQSSAGGSGQFYYGAAGLQAPPFPSNTRPTGSTQSRSRSATLNHLPSQRGPQMPAGLESFFPGASTSQYASGMGGFAPGSAPRLPPGMYTTDNMARLPRSVQPGRHYLESYNTPRTSGGVSSATGYFSYRGYNSGGSSSTGPGNINRPLPPPPQIPEEDQCPICHHELPSRLLPNYETLREQHITTCIEQHTFKSEPSTTGQTGAAGTSPARVARRNGLISYIASEKDRNSDEECVICFDSFEPGTRMARLECWCRFHYDCISEWFERRGHGRCPVHHHDSSGY